MAPAALLSARVLWILVVAVCLGAAGQAGAMGFTIDADYDIDFTGSSGVVDGKLKAVAVNTISFADVADSLNSIDFDTEDFLVFEVELFNPSAIIDQIGFAVATLTLGTTRENNPIDVGYLTGPGAVPFGNVNAAALQDLTGASGFPGAALYSFDLNVGSTNNIEAGETTVRLFATYELGELQTGQAANFMFSSGTNDDFGVQIVPEPVALLLLGSVLLSLGIAGWGRA